MTVKPSSISSFSSSFLKFLSVSTTSSYSDEESSSFLSSLLSLSLAWYLGLYFRLSLSYFRSPPSFGFLGPLGSRGPLGLFGSWFPFPFSFPDSFF